MGQQFVLAINFCSDSGSLLYFLYDSKVRDIEYDPSKVANFVFFGQI